MILILRGDLEIYRGVKRIVDVGRFCGAIERTATRPGRPGQPNGRKFLLRRRFRMPVLK